MKRALVSLAAVCVLIAQATPGASQEYTSGPTSMEPRVGGYGITNFTNKKITPSGAVAQQHVADGAVVENTGAGAATDQTADRRALPGHDSRETVTNAAGAAGMARWDFVRTKKGTLSLGAGDGGVFSNTELPYTRSKHGGAGQADLGSSVALNKNVSLKAAAGQYQRLGEFSDKGFEHFGGNLGLKINF